MTWITSFGLATLLVVAGVVPSSVAEELQSGAVPKTAPTSKQGSADPALAKVRSAVAAAQRRSPIPSFAPSLSTLSGREADVGRCDYTYNVNRLCRHGDRSSSRTIVLLGDSHARHWIPAVNWVARRHGYAAYFLVKPGCNAADTLRSHLPRIKSCVRFRAWAAERIARLDPEILVISGEVPPTSLNANGTLVRNHRILAQLYSRGLVRTIRRLQPSVGKVAIIGDVPGLRRTPGECLRNSNDLGDCTFTRAPRTRIELRAAQRAASRTTSRFINPTKWFCYRGLCPTIVDHVLTYKDLRHVLPRYSKSLGPSLGRSLRH